MAAETLKEKLTELQNLVDRQADDMGLWFYAERITEEYLQDELRKLHAAVEKVTEEYLL